MFFLKSSFEILRAPRHPTPNLFALLFARPPFLLQVGVVSTGVAKALQGVLVFVLSHVLYCRLLSQLGEHNTQTRHVWDCHRTADQLGWCQGGQYIPVP